MFSTLAMRFFIATLAFLLSGLAAVEAEAPPLNTLLQRVNYIKENLGLDGNFNEVLRHRRDQLDPHREGRP